MPSIRLPVRPISYSESATAFPRELMIDFSTGKFYIITPSGATVENAPANGVLQLSNAAGAQLGQFSAASTDITKITLPNASKTVDGLMTAAQVTSLEGKANLNHASTNGAAIGLANTNQFGHVKFINTNGLKIANGIASMDASSANTPGSMSAADFSKLQGIAAGANNYTLPTATTSTLGGVKSGADVIINGDGTITIDDNSHGHIVSNISGLQAALDGKINSSLIGVANGVVPVGADGFIASKYLPAYIDNVDEFDTMASFPANGIGERIYVAKDTNKTYRWSGSNYVCIGSDLALGETSSTAYAGDKGKAVTDALASHSGNGTIHISAAERNTWNAKSNLGLGETNATAYSGDKGKAVTDAFASHNGNTTVHISTAERNTWNAKSNLALGETSATAYAGDKGKAVMDAFNGHTGNTSIHLSIDDRNNWNGKAAGAHTHTPDQAGAFPSGGWRAATDFNNLIYDGFYQCQGVNLNTPLGSTNDTHFYIIVLRHADSWVRQIAYDVRGTDIWSRSKCNNAWGNWTIFWTSNHIIPIWGGGTGTGDPNQARINIGAASTVTYNSNIGTNWSGTSAPFTQYIGVGGVTTADNPIIDIVPDATYATAAKQIEAYGAIYRITTNNNSIMVYANAKTTTAIPIQIKCIR